MSERKVLQKYYPPDFDPSKITRHKGPKPTGPKQQTVRLMTPFSMRCNSCGEFIYKGRKFNARKENSGEKYLSISIFRFYIRCTRCSAEITFKTAPQYMDYECEKGATRNFEPWREGRKEETEEEMLKRLEEEENESAMSKLESKTLDTKREMEVADKLDEIRSRNARMERVDANFLDRLLETSEGPSKEEEEAEREIEEAAKRAFSTVDGEKVRRAVDDEGEAGIGKAPAEKEKEKEKEEVPTFKKTVKRKRDLGAALGIKKKAKLPV